MHHQSCGSGKNGGLRLFAESSSYLHLKGKLIKEELPLPDKKTSFHNFHGSRFFSGIDLSDAYHQIGLDDEARELCTINTQKALFKMWRLPQWWKNSCPIFQNCTTKLHCVKGIKCALTLQNDRLVFGISQEQYKKTMTVVNGRLIEKNHHQRDQVKLDTTLNCFFLDYSVSTNGIKSEDRPVEKLGAQDTREPERTSIILLTGQLLRTKDSELCHQDVPTQGRTESSLLMEPYWLQFTFQKNF